MRDDSLIKKRAKKAAIIIGIMTFVGFSGILFIPQLYMMGLFTPYIIFGQLILFTPVGLLEAFILGWVVYFIFKHIKSKLIYTILLTIGIIICFPLGFFSNVHLFRFATKRPPYMNEIDTNRDGKIDKWVYHYDVSTRAEIDSNFDGTPDIKEYYDNGELFKKEIDTDFDGKIDKVENYRFKK